MNPPYNMSFACLECHKSFKRGVHIDNGIPDELHCPDCGQPSYNFGRNFKAPKRSNLRQWEKIRFLKNHGFRFQKIRPHLDNDETIPYPETLEDAKEFVIKYKKYAID